METKKSNSKMQMANIFYVYTYTNTYTDTVTNTNITTF